MAKYENKTKQNKTKQNTFTLSGIVSRVKLAKPTIYILLVTFLPALSSKAVPPPPLPPTGVPNGYCHKCAQMPTHRELTTFEPTFWTFNYDAIKSFCGEKVYFNTVITVATYDSEGALVSSGETIVVPNTNWSGDYLLNTQIIVDKLVSLGIEPPPGGKYMVTHLAFYITIDDGSTVGKWLNPDETNRVKTGLPAPCDCLQFYFDTKTQTVFVSPGYCDDL